MNSDPYSLSDSYVPVGGDALIAESLDKKLKALVGAHYLIASALILVMVLIIIMMLWNGKELFNPTQTLRMQKRDDHGENLEGDRGKSAFVQQVQSGAIIPVVYDASAQAGMPGSVAWQILHSDEYDCANRKSNDDVENAAWSWMNNVAHESLHGDKPKTDNEFSKILAGQ